MVLALLLISMVSAHAQTDLSKHVKETISVGNINALTNHFTENVDISIDGVDAIYSRSQAAMILKKFFENNAVVEYSSEHEGAASSSNQYYIGKMTCKSGKYRVTYFVTSAQNGQKIKQFNIEKY